MRGRTSWPATHLAFEVHPTDRTPSDFRGAVTRRPIGDLMLVDCAASPFLGHRGRAVMTPETEQEDILGFQFVCKGIETVREGSRVLALTPATWCCGTATSRPRSRSSRRSTSARCCSRATACSRSARGWPSCEPLPPLDGSGPARLLVRYMNALALEQPRLEGAAGVAAANAALELLRAAVEPCVPDQPRRRPRGDAGRDPALRAHPPTGPGARAGLDRPRLRDVGARAARAVRGRRRVGGGAGPLASGSPAAWRTSSGPTAGRSPTSRSAGGSATPRTSRACSSARSGSPRARCASRRCSATSSAERSTTTRPRH